MPEGALGTQPEGAPAPPLVSVICGPTAAGKSAIALWLCEQQGATLISADSRQIYRGFDVGTAKPTPEEQHRVTHRGVDVADPEERWSAARWAAAADGWLREAASRHRPAVVVGGTGFYLRALLEPLFDEPVTDGERRRAVERWLDALSVPELRRWCEVLDPARAGLGRAQLQRAVLVALLVGRRISTLHATRARPPLRTARYLLVDPGAVLRDRIAHRVDAMLAAGWLEEVRALEATVPPAAPAWNATGYEALRAHLGGALTLEQARERITTGTRQYAKRQRTWFRHQLKDADVTRVDPGQNDWQSVAERWWRGEGRRDEDGSA